MKNFESLDKRKISEVEKDILKHWEEHNIFEKSIENRSKDNNFVFYDGPATANGMPGLHHMLPKVLKDTFGKYQTMKGHRVLRKVGWDTHGLPVELQVEKQLGFKSKNDIEKYGIEPFNQKCRESVWENEAAFTRLTKEMGQFIDLDHPYVTYDNNYIETEWWILKKFFDENLFYEGYKILPYCPRCGTGLASHEVAQGYKDVTVNTVTVPFKLKDEDCYFLVWTTTPWTLIANVALCVNPNEEYIKAESMGYKFVVAKKLANKVLGDEYKVIETYVGRDLEHKEYEQLLPFITPNKKAFFVTCDTYVTMEDGTGIVHIAPAFGADDYEVGKYYNLPVINPVGEDGKYLEGPWQGRFVMDSELELDIIKYLKENDKLFKKEKLVHNYPHCWRCDTPLLYYPKESWFVAMSKLRNELVDNNNKFESLIETHEYNIEYNSVLAARDQLLKDIAAETVLTGATQDTLYQYNETLERYENITRIEKNKIFNINLKNITYFTTYKCSVFRNDVFIGTTSITIINDITSNLTYSLVINNGDQVFKYNEAGIAPNSESLENPMPILPLSFTLYDKDGKEIKQSLIEPQNVYWTVPLQHTLIEEPTEYQVYKTTNDYVELNNTRELAFNIHNTFRATHENNIINLTVKYKGHTISASTNFTFIKTGEVGTNGTDYVCKLIPNLASDAENVNYPIVIYNEDTNEYALNYRVSETNAWFKAQL